ncbi:MAG: STAS domain-containing protein [Spirochaetales bacterium]|nr:STAS domain-containing protein [Spirochaetales bacterium]
MKVTVEKEGPVTVVTLYGDVVLYQNQELKDILSRLEQEKAQQILLDFSGVRYIDSASIGSLMSYQSQINRRGGEITLCGLLPSVNRIFEMNGLSSLFKIFPDQATALCSSPIDLLPV